MTRLSTEEASAVVKAAIADIAPDIAEELDVVDPGVDVWELLELDSMDHQNVMALLYDRTGVDIPEREYGRLRTIASLADHLAGAAA